MTNVSTPRYRLLADRAGSFFVASTLISVLVHGALMWTLADRSFGRIDPAILGQQNTKMIHIRRRVDQDIIAADPASAAGNGSTTASQTQAKQPDVSQLSTALLDDLSTPKEATDQTPQAVELNAVKEQRPEEIPGGTDGLKGVPSVELPDDVKASMAVKLNMEVAYTPSIGVGGTNGSGTGTGEGAGAGAGRAVDILANSGLLRGFNPEPPKLDRPEFHDRRSAAVDRREVEKPIESPAIDFAEVALSGTTKIEIPEHLDSDFEYFVTRYQSPMIRQTGWFNTRNAESDRRGYFRVDIVPQKSLRRLPTMPKDVVILIDISGSIPQVWVEQMVRGVRDGLATLNKGDRFNIVFFSENPVFFSTEGNQPFNDKTYRAALKFLTDRKAKGFTDVNAALARLLVRDLAIERVYNLVLISDGRPTRGVMDTRELINLLTRDNDLVASIYCVGVTSRQNRALLEFLAYRNKGYCLFASSELNAANTIRDILSRLRYPIMKDVRLSLAGMDPEDVFPRDLPNLYQGERFTIYGRYDHLDPFTMRLVGHNGRRVLDLTFARDLKKAPKGEVTMATSWAFWKLHHLYSEMFRQGKTQGLKKQIQMLRKKYKLTTLY